MTLEVRLARAWSRLAAVGGAVAGLSVGGARETAATGTADADSGRMLTAADRLPVASLTKPVVATAAVRLWQQRRVGLTAPMVDLLQELAPHWRASRRISLRHVLSHTSGLRPDVTPDELAAFGDAEDALSQAVRQTVQYGQTYRPGAAWRYSNAGYGLAGYALGAIAGSTFEHALRNELFAVAGMTRSGFDPGDAVGHADGAPIRAVYAKARRPGGGLVSTVDDLLSFAEFAMDDAASWLATGGAVASSQLGSGYGLGWNLDLGGRVRWHGGDWGGCHAMLMAVPSRRIAVVVVTTDDAGAKLRRDFAWAELTRLAGLRRARLVPAVRTTVATLRGAAARAVGAAVPRTLSS
jgi:D-alanyl-D-alanine carboxypeptidase